MSNPTLEEVVTAGWNRSPELELKITGEIKSLSVKPGDIIVATFKDTLSAHRALHVRAELKKLFPNNESLVVSAGELSVMTPDSM